MVTTMVGYARTHQFFQSLRNDVSPLRALVGMDFPVAAGQNGVPVAQSDAATATIAARVTDAMTVTGSVYRRRFTGLVLPDPSNENLFAVAGFDSAAATVTGAGVAVEGGYGVVRWYTAYGIARTAATIQHTTSYNTTPVVGRSALASVTVAIAPTTHLQVTGWAATNQQAAQLTQTGGYGEPSDDNNHVSPTPGSTLSAWLPKYRRVDLSLSHALSIGMHGNVSTFVAVANLFNRANVATFLRARANASGTASSNVVWQPVILAPRSLQAGLSWQY